MQVTLMEYVSTISVIKAFSKEEEKTSQAIQATKDYVYWVKKAMGGFSIPMGLLALTMEMGVLCVIIYGSILFANGEISLTRFIMCMTFSTAFTASISKAATFQHFNIVFNQSMMAIGTIVNVPLEEREDYPETIQEGGIEIRNLTFGYDKDSLCLDDINLVFKKGTTNAIVGPSGCGKSTLAHLLMGFWLADKGSITVDGVPINLLSQRQLSGLNAIVQQDIHLFNMTIEENIKIGNEQATTNDVIAAAKKASIHEFIMALPKGYDTMVGESGVKFSGGEKQRIALARILLKNAPFIILDEATAAVDRGNKASINVAIKEFSQDKTVIVIDHDLNTIAHVDQIICMDKGRVKSIGTHEKLLNECEQYKEMFTSQQKVENWTIKELSS